MISLKTEKRAQITAAAASEFPRPGKDLFYLQRENNPRRRHATSFSCLGKIVPADAALLDRWKRQLERLLTESAGYRPFSENPLVIGLSESGIIPSALFHQVLTEKGASAGWICSTRRPASGIPFSESHSHGPDHLLPLPETAPTELCFVEDEITTGRTLLYLILRVCAAINVRRVRIFAFTDTRTDILKNRFQALLKADGIQAVTHVLARFEPLRELKEVPALAGHPETAPAEPAVRPNPEKGWLLPRLRPGLSEQRRPHLPCLTPPKGTGALLAVGEAIDLGLRTAQAHPGLRLHHVTLSPWEIDGHHIRTRLTSGNGYYLYNPHRLKPPVLLLHDPVDDEIAAAMSAVLKKEGFSVRPLERNAGPGEKQ